MRFRTVQNFKTQKQMRGIPEARHALSWGAIKQGVPFHDAELNGGHGDC